MSIQVLVIINPASGKGKIENKIAQMKQNIEEQGMEVTIKLTKKEFNAEKIVEKEQVEKDLILVCGGDGTLNEAITAIMKQKKEDFSLSFIPMGTTNDFAKSLHMPIKDISITKKLLETKARKVDIGKLNQEQYFCYVAAFGIITDVPYITSQKAKHRYGRLAYYYHAIKELFHMKAHKIKLTYDKQEIEDEFIYGGISNSESIAGFRWFERGEILLDDGLFEGIFVRKPRNLKGYFKILASFLKKDYTENEWILFMQAKDLKIESEEPIKWTMDGEFAGDLQEVTIENCYRAIEFAIYEKEGKK